MNILKLKQKTAFRIALVSAVFLLFPVILAVTAPVWYASAADEEETVSLPEVSVAALLTGDTVEREQAASLEVIVTNKSASPLSNISISVIPTGFNPEYPEGMTENAIPPFGTLHVTVDLTPDDQVGFGKHTLICTVDYSWGEDLSFRSSGSATADITVKRKFEDEIGGLLGGGAALLYFLLPIYPAIAAYQIVDSLRKGEKLKAPSVTLTTVFPGIVLSIAVNLLIRPVIATGDALDNTGNFFMVVACSLFAGAVIPFSRWTVRRIRQHIWAYRESDTALEYLKKLLHNFGVKNLEQEVVTVASGSQVWEGILLEKRKTCCFIGATLKCHVAQNTTKFIAAEIFTPGGSRVNKEKLMGNIKSGNLILSCKRKISYRYGTRKNKMDDKYVVRISGMYEISETGMTRFLDYTP